MNGMEIFMTVSFMVITMLSVVCSIIGYNIYYRMSQTIRVEMKNSTFELASEFLEKNRQIFLLLNVLINLGIIYSFSILISLLTATELTVFYPYILRFIVEMIFGLIVFVQNVYYLYILVELKNIMYFVTLKALFTRT